MNKMERKSVIKRRNHQKFLNKKLASCRDVDNGTAAVDRISRLPDEIRVDILSRLTVKEAIATSLLSTSWRHLYTFIDRLNFPPFEFANSRNPRCFHKPSHREKREEFSNYLSSIDRTLDSCCNAILKEFSVEIIDCLEGANLERWLDFTLARKVETINIKMCYVENERFHYALRLSNILVGPSKTLKKLSLWGVRVEDSEIELLLSSFLLLESLSISVSETLKNVSVVGSGDRGMKLSRLDIYYAVNLKSVEIRDMINLECFECFGHRKCVVRLINVPKLTEFRVSKLETVCLVTIPYCVLDQLRRLYRLWMYEPFTMIRPSHEPLKNLRRIEIKVFMDPRYSNHRLEKLFPLIEACCALETLEIEFMWNHVRERRVTYVADHMLSSPKTRLSTSQNLKKMVLSGYMGIRMEEVKFALFIMNNVRALEQLTVITCDVNPKVKKMATARAHKDFKPITPPSVNLSIL